MRYPVSKIPTITRKRSISLKIDLLFDIRYCNTVTTIFIYYHLYFFLFMKNAKSMNTAINVPMERTCSHIKSSMANILIPFTCILNRYCIYLRIGWIPQHIFIKKTSYRGRSTFFSSHFIEKSVACATFGKLSSKQKRMHTAVLLGRIVLPKGAL